MLSFAASELLHIVETLLSMFRAHVTESARFEANALEQNLIALDSARVQKYVLQISFVGSSVALKYCAIAKQSRALLSRAKNRLGTRYLSAGKS